MINSEPTPQNDDAVHTIVSSGMVGAVVLAGIATAIVFALWLAFYLLVFIPRGPGAGL
jgi:hypothetical protein